MIEIYKTKKSLNPSFMSEIFEARDVQYDLRNKNTLGIPNAKTTSWHRNCEIFGSKAVANITSQC